MASQISVFISYAREDSAFVDRLEADLQARNFRTWVDRGKLEGGQVWMDELEKAISRCQITLVVLSPKAVVSKYVRMEYRFAQSLNKLIIPLEYQSCPQVPIDLNSLQWVIFKDSYEQGLNDLLIALNPIELVTLPPPIPPVQTTKALSLIETTKEPDLVVPQPAPPPPDSDLSALYRAGIAAKAEGDLERTAILWQQVLSRDSNFGNGILSVLMEQVQKELRPYRIQLLRDRAKKAQSAGEWRQAIGAWEALLGLAPTDKEALANRAIAEDNQKFVWMYETALQFAREGQNQAAKIQLDLLWQYAPNYGDPASISKKVGIPMIRLKSGYAGKMINERGTYYEFILEISSQTQGYIVSKFRENNNNNIYNIDGYISDEGDIVLRGTGGTSSNNKNTIEFIGKCINNREIDAKIMFNSNSDPVEYNWLGKSY